MRKKVPSAAVAVGGLPRLKPVDRGSVTSQIYNHVRQALMQGEFEPGQVITIDSMAKFFGTSHMPVREALGRLVSANALVALPNRSVAVPMISLSSLRDIMNVRAEVESLAGSLAAAKLNADALAQIVSEQRNMAAAIEAQDVREYLAVHQAFHFAIYRASQSAALPNLIETLWLQSGPYLNLLVSDEGFQPDGSEHDAIMAGIEAQDSDATSAAIRAGIYGALATLESLIVDQLDVKDGAQVQVAR